MYVESQSERISQLETERITFTDTIDELQSLLNHKNMAIDILQVLLDSIHYTSTTEMQGFRFHRTNLNTTKWHTMHDCN